MNLSCVSSGERAGCWRASPAEPSPAQGTTDPTLGRRAAVVALRDAALAEDPGERRSLMRQAAELILGRPGRR